MSIKKTAATRYSLNFDAKRPQDQCACDARCWSEDGGYCGDCGHSDWNLRDCACSQCAAIDSSEGGAL